METTVNTFLFGAIMLVIAAISVFTFSMAAANQREMDHCQTLKGIPVRTGNGPVCLHPSSVIRLDPNR